MGPPEHTKFSVNNLKLKAGKPALNTITNQCFCLFSLRLFDYEQFLAHHICARQDQTVKNSFKKCHFDSAKRSDKAGRRIESEKSLAHSEREMTGWMRDQGERSRAWSTNTSNTPNLLQVNLLLVLYAITWFDYLLCEPSHNGVFAVFLQPQKYIFLVSSAVKATGVNSVSRCDPSQ